MFPNGIASGVAALAVLLAATGPQGTAQQTRAVTVHLLAINDFHGNLEPPTGSDGRVNQTPAGGAEYLATHLRNCGRRLCASAPATFPCWRGGFWKLRRRDVTDV